MHSALRAVMIGVIVSITTIGVQAAATPLKLKGWKETEPPKMYNERTLPDLINGAAELYFDYGFQNLALHKFGNKKYEVDVSIYNQGKPINAFGVFRRERPESATTVNVGAQSALSLPYSCTMQKGEMYVRVQMKKGDLTSKLCEKWLKAVARTIEGTAALPKSLAQLPEQGKVPNSEGYTRGGYLGVSDLSNSLHAKYKTADGQTYQLFTLIAETKESTEKTWQKLSKKWKPATIGGKTALTRQIPYRDPVIIIKTQKGIFGIADAGKMAAAEKIVESINID